LDFLAARIAAVRADLVMVETGGRVDGMDWVNREVREGARKADKGVALGHKKAA
jgi:hypothetical protein